MPRRESLSGPATNVPVTVLDSSAVKLSGAKSWAITRRQLSGGLSAGVEIVDISNGLMTVSVVPTRGMGVFRAQCGEIPVEWKSPVRQLVNPVFLDLGSRNGLGWLDGFNELVCRCGLSFNGPPGDDQGAKGATESHVTLHGRTANIPAYDVIAEVDEAGQGTLSVAGTIDECTMFGPQLRLRSTVSTVAGSTSFTIRDEIENLASTPAEVELLYHVNVGRPFLEQGSSVSCPANVVVPRDPRAAEGIDEYQAYLGPTPGYAEQVYYYEPKGDGNGESLALLKNAHGHLGFSVGFNVKELPRFSLWKCTQPDSDGYVTGLEPGTNYPNFKTYERDQKRLVLLAPGAKYSAGVTITVHNSAQSVAEAEARIKKIQGDRPAQVHKTPQQGWSAAGGA
jgi:hypothetical protein